MPEPPFVSGAQAGLDLNQLAQEVKHRGRDRVAEADVRAAMAKGEATGMPASAPGVAASALESKLASAEAPAHGAQLGEAALVSFAPGADAVSDPVLFHCDLAVELVTLGFLLREDNIAPGFECGKALLKSARHAAVEPKRRA